MPSSTLDKEAPVKKGMAEWYDPGLLLRTGVRSFISTLFGHFADKREAIAAANAIQPTPADGEFDYSRSNPGGDFWFDYLADTGDGWNPTFAMARLAAKENLTGEKDPRGRLLILGGDQVYPTASPEEYRDRFVVPFDRAYRPDDNAQQPHLYAIPGNHDWYDGLNSFFGLFCRRRVVRGSVDLGVSREGKVIGGRRTQQTRSYFAIELPNDWWVWGTDCQLEGYIDQPQIDYFQHAAAYWMKPNSKLILCVADPAWAYVDPKDPEKKFSSLSYLERLAGLARVPLTKDQEERGERLEDQPPMGHDLKLVLTGDSHHYCRWIEDDRNYVVCGGGGAFLHPTHHLKDKCFSSRFPKPGVEGRPGSYPREFKIAKTADGQEALFPDRKTSRKLAWGNVKFAWLNKKFVFALLCIYAIFNWVLDFNAGIARHETLAHAVRQDGWPHALQTYWELVVVSPWSFLLVAISAVAYVQFAESPYSKWLQRFMGLGHAAAQAVAVTVTTVGVLLLTKGMVPWEWARWDSLISAALATVASAIISGIVFGLYLLASLNLLGRHPNEGFSSMAIEDYKSFLRLRIDKNGCLTIFPIGLKDVPKSDNGELRHHLIEPPIRIAP